MNALRDELHEIANEAPVADLADVALQGARRRRTSRLVLASAIAIAVIIGGTAALTNGLDRTNHPIVIAPPVETAEPLPRKGVGPLSHAYLHCPESAEGCEDRQWRVITRSGETYEIANALGQGVQGDMPSGPLVITDDGRRMVYIDAKDLTVSVRDLATGQVWRSRQKLPKAAFKGDLGMRISPDGLRVIHVNANGRSSHHVLVDLRSGRSRNLPANWWPVSVADGDGPVTLIRPYEDETRIQVLGHDPIVVKDFTYDFSALAPDGRTLARLGQTYDRKARPMIQQDRTIVTVNAITGGGSHKVPVTGIPSDMTFNRLGHWVNAAEVTLYARPSQDTFRNGESRDGETTLYAVNITTGKARPLITYPANAIVG
ncbi:hypothetical protein [Streptosporangium sp. KLBMP 9127]|nr:hypothetical protein [Streptosporangium sp. KLBMP 9127]